MGEQRTHTLLVFVNDISESVLASRNASLGMLR